MSEDNAPVVHLRPRQGENVLPCCGEPYLGDAVTSNISDVTCPSMGERRRPGEDFARQFVNEVTKAVASDPDADGFIFGMTPDGKMQNLGPIGGSGHSDNPFAPPTPRPGPSSGPLDPTANPPHGKPGHRCIELSDELVMDINTAATKVTEMVLLHRKRLIEAGVAEPTADAMAAQYHAMLLMKTF